ncbi:hypothetical protein GCM10027280_31840 [Micromonospora polyrhachis]|uniref:Uncharacterized protein n=1 Tax=Micromonospora polyrhachis TaxID=1282883 RepID=A0A7W7STT5_9ACTN|nr:Imm1 family immunity protein [Micromonospora polyrhachis]MBB4960779.1 hypothetical protein [Micromonospora polyrhachis]
MTFAMVDYHGHCETLSDPADAADWFDEQAGTIMSHGGSGQVIRFGRADGATELRVDIDVDVDLAALCWVADGAHAVEFDPVAAITVLESPDTGLITVPASRARVRAATARQAVLEYVTTGQRPTCVTWVRDPDHPDEPG